MQEMKAVSGTGGFALAFLMQHGWREQTSSFGFWPHIGYSNTGSCL